MSAVASITQPVDPPVPAPDCDHYELRGRLRVLSDCVDRPREPEVPEPLVISPELALVCPELRALALQLLPERDPDAFLPKLSQTRPAPTVAQLPPPTESIAEQVETSERGPGVAIAVAAYAAKQAASVAVHAATLLAVIASVLLLMRFAHS
jgi:hypothetical protein